MGNFYVMVGIPGAGKSTRVAEMKFSGTMVVCPDDMREFRGISGSNIEASKYIFSWAQRLVVDFLFAGYDVVLDATNLRRSLRQEFVQSVKHLANRVICHVVDTSVEVAIARHRQRLAQGKKIGLSVWTIRRMADEMEYPSQDEGFDQIIYMK